MSGASVIVQEMTIGDYNEVRALWQACEGIELSEADARSVIVRFLERNPGLSFVARVDGVLVGAALCGHDGRRGYIDRLAVHPSHRCQGIGRILTSRCLYHLMKCGITKWYLFVPEDNQGAIAFWQKLGWQQRGELVTMSGLNTAEHT